MFGVFVQPHGIRLEQRSHLVNEGTGTSSTDSIHTLFHISALKIDDLGVLTAQLDGYVRLRRVMLQSCGHSDDFLDKWDTEVIGKRQAAGASNHRRERKLSQLLIRLMEQG